VITRYVSYSILDVQYSKLPLIIFHTAK